MGHSIQWVDAKPLHDLINHHNMSVPEIVTRTGLSQSALYAWERTKKMPSYMRQVCRGIVAEKNGEKVPVTEAEMFILKVAPERREFAQQMLAALRAGGVPFRSLNNFD